MTHTPRAKIDRRQIEPLPAAIGRVESDGNGSAKRA